MASNLGRTKVTRLAGALALTLAAPFTQGATGVENNLEARLLASHNRERSSLGIPPLVWDRKLARDAQAYVLHLAETGYLVHSEDDPADPDPQGENLWAGTSGYYGPEAMVGLWIEEKKDFKPGIFPNNSISGDLEQVGHYTQLMWRSSHSVGCAAARGAEDDFLVCRYSEGGNVIGERPF
ncbi:SCP-like extracellular [Sphingomonas sp. Root710]|uniref:CAP domain-containing protein n=1 Tax=Sphingomonas sp. Root710 TaxID=1736594 RepID=UPI0007000967|nr:CAP domain-containing protein [Sphingomonas sp. Root710]KRB82533.1 SCP-like extracellular [Sphingomonas sp. Root710]